MTTLSEITEPDEAAELMARSAAGRGGKNEANFDSLLRQQAAGADQPPPTEPGNRPRRRPAGGPSPALRELMGRLRALQNA
jgi:hypothetical protein